MVDAFWLRLGMFATFTKKNLCFSLFNHYLVTIADSLMLLYIHDSVKGVQCDASLTRNIYLSAQPLRQAVPAF
ncbi:hypothetical protein Hdeb2414_s0057g00757841 [Helianthus debilis subsp. tardiflorus]